MATILWATDFEEGTLTVGTMKSYKTYLVDPYDFSICCTWIPSAAIKIEKHIEGFLCTNLENDTYVRLLKLLKKEPLKDS